MKLPNGFGSVHKMTGKRRNPWRARITIGYTMDEDGERCKQVYATLGYYKTKKDAICALSHYHNDPYDLKGGSATLNDVYNSWYDDKIKDKNNSYKRVVQACWRYCASLHNRRVDSIRTHDLIDCVEHAHRFSVNDDISSPVIYASATTKCKVKSVLNLLFDYALEREIVPHNYARDFKISDEIVEESVTSKKTRKIFSDNEIEALWKMTQSDECARIIIVGMRE